jgi:hypothetical protein
MVTKQMRGCDPRNYLNQIFQIIQFIEYIVSDQINSMRISTSKYVSSV